MFAPLAGMYQVMQNGLPLQPFWEVILLQEVNLKKQAQHIRQPLIQVQQTKLTLQRFQVATVTSMAHTLTLDSSVSGGVLLSTRPRMPIITICSAISVKYTDSTTISIMASLFAA